MKKTILDFQQMKKDEEKIAWVTAYDYPFASVAESAGMDMILVGDSGGMTTLGYETTNPVTMDEMIMLASSVRRGAPGTFVVGDLPQGSYEPSNRDAVVNAMRFIKEAGCAAVKLEGGKRVCDRVKAIVDAGILTIGHGALTPQSTETIGGYRVCCKTLESFDKTMEDALALQEAGVCMLLLEGTPGAPAQQIATRLKIPVLGIGAGLDVDGQLVIMHDLMGFYQPFRPWFAKCYIPDVIAKFNEHVCSLEDPKVQGRKFRNDGLLVLAEMAIKKYIEDVKNRKFPSKEYCYLMKEEELANVKKSIYWEPVGTSI